MMPLKSKPLVRFIAIDERIEAVVLLTECYYIQPRTLFVLFCFVCDLPATLLLFVILPRNGYSLLTERLLQV